MGRIILALGLLGLLPLVQVESAEAAAATADLSLGLHVAARVAAQADRTVVALEPGQSQTVTLTLKARMAASDAAVLSLGTSLSETDAALVTYQFDGATGPLAGSTRLGAIRGSGVHTLPLTLTLAPEATGPVTLDLAVHVALDGAPVGRSGAASVHP